jgi:hypothetical protein
VNRWTAVEQSIFVEAQLAELFNSFATSFYNVPEAQRFWESMAGSEADHAMLLVFEKWRIVREDIDSAVIRYDDQSLLRQMKTFDDLRAAVVHPPEFKQTLEIALKAENMALEFHGNQIFIADVGVSDRVLQILADTEEIHREVLEQLINSSDPVAAVKEMDLSRIREVPAE